MKANVDEPKTSLGMELEGEVLGGHYKLEKKIGQGGMAWVYRATHLLLGGKVAVKILFPQLAESENTRVRFLREAQIQHRLQHPHIVRVLEFIDERGLAGFVSEWCDGGDLVDWFDAQRRPLEPGEIRSLMVPILEAMQVAHDNGVVHRDLKPHNVMLHRLGDVLQPRVTDFGIAKQVDQDSLTSTGVVMGTLQYMSPEQLSASKSLDLRSDIYSLGVMLYEFAAGELPFEGDSQLTLFMQILNDEPHPIPDISEPLQDIIQRCLAKKPEQRFQSCLELKAALEECLPEPAPLFPIHGHSAEIPTGKVVGASIALGDTDVVESLAITQPPAATDRASSPRGIVPTESAISHIQYIPEPEEPRATWKLWLVALLVASFVGGGLWLWQSFSGKKPVTQVGKTKTATRPLLRYKAPTPLEKCLKGDGKLCMALAVLEMKKQKGSRDYKLARRLYQKACEQKLGKGCFAMGNLWALGKGGIKSASEGLKYFMKSCELEQAMGCWYAGQAFRRGIGGELNDKKAVKFFTDACRLKHANACSTLGVMYSKGMGTGPQPDYAKAIALYKKACTLKSPYGCHSLALYYRRGTGVSVDNEKAYTFYKQACSLGFGVSCYRTAQTLYHLRGRNSCKEVDQWLQHACKLKFLKACQESCKLY